jgi:hypothetical protein
MKKVLLFGLVMYSRLGMMDEVPELELIRQVCVMIRMLNANRSKSKSF